MAVTVTNASYALKTLYSRERVEKILYEDNPLLAMISKNEDFTGKNKFIGLVYAPPAGRSSVFATAQANKGQSSGGGFTITRASDYSLVSITGEAIEASKSDAGALVNLLDQEFELGYHAIRRSLATALYGDGAGNIGQILTVSGGVITLTNVNDITNFEVGMVLQANPTRTGTSGNMRSGTGTISAVDRDAGTITYTGTITSVAANDYLYVQGDYDAKVKGLAAWIPSTAPTSTLFFGQDRSVDATRLGGIRFDGSALNPDEALIKALVRANREGGSPEVIVCNPGDWQNVDLSLGTKVRYDMVDVKTDAGVEVGFKAILINGPRKSAKLVADQNCPSGVAYALTMGTLSLESLNMAPHILNLDGNRMLREAASDGYEGRIGYYAQMACKAPGYNVRIAMPS